MTTMTDMSTIATHKVENNDRAEERVPNFVSGAEQLSSEEHAVVALSSLFCPVAYFPYDVHAKQTKW